MTDLTTRRERPFTPCSLDDPLFWCSPCADDYHQEHVEVFYDVHRERHACLCPTCE